MNVCKFVLDSYCQSHPCESVVWGLQLQEWHSVLPVATPSPPNPSVTMAPTIARVPILHQAEPLTAGTGVGAEGVVADVGAGVEEGGAFVYVWWG